jgi:hypothetical protein
VRIPGILAYVARPGTNDTAAWVRYERRRGEERAVGCTLIAWVSGKKKESRDKMVAGLDRYLGRQEMRDDPVPAKRC